MNKTADALALIGMLLRLGIDLKATAEAISESDSIGPEQLKWSKDEMVEAVDNFVDEFSE